MTVLALAEIRAGALYQQYPSRSGTDRSAALDADFGVVVVPFHPAGRGRLA